MTTGAWSHYDNDSSQYEATYGKLYNWYAVETGKLCPTGWHVPTDAEWTVLTDYLAANGHSGADGKALRAAKGWVDYSGESDNGTDNYGFNGVPAGVRYDTGIYNSIGRYGALLSSNQEGTSYAWTRELHNKIYRRNYLKNNGYSIRCLRD